MPVLIIFNREPYDGTDVTWNGLRLADKLREKGAEVRIFLMNDSVDLARDVCKPPPEYDKDLSGMLRELIAQGVVVKVCGTCMARCGVYKNHPYFDGAEKSTMLGCSASASIEPWLRTQAASKAKHWPWCLNSTTGKVRLGSTLILGLSATPQTQHQYPKR